MSGFIHLHVHTEYSLLDGAARINDVVRKAASLDMPALAMTDHGVLYGAVDFYKRCRDEGIKPILGCEVYVAPRTIRDRTPKVDDNLYHLVLLAENKTGWQNLIKLVSLSFTDGFYYKPRVDKEVLARHSKGLIALSGCVAGEVPTHILNDNPKQAREVAATYLDIFGRGNYFLEIQDHGMPEQRKVNREMAKIAREMEIPLVASNDVHYVEKEHAQIQDVLLCIQTGKTIDDEDRMKFDSQELYFKSAQEMSALFAELPSALANTVEIADRCNVELEFGRLHLPDYRVPDGHTAESYLRELCWRGVKWRYGFTFDCQTVKKHSGSERIELQPGCKTVKKRLEYELSIIEKMGYAEYFLIVWDFINFARKERILVGPGRGSAAGSLVAYCLGITNIDPLRYGLLFERFLNPERVSMPDIDVDFCFERRGEVINYIIDKYGEDKVAQIITFGTMAARAAIRDVGRVLNMPYSEVDKVAKLVPLEIGMTIEKALSTSQELSELREKDPQVKKLIDMAAGIEGMPRHASTHAAGVVIARKPLINYVPLYRVSENKGTGYRSSNGVLDVQGRTTITTTQFAKEQVEELGLLKMDLLGLRTLTVLGEAVRLVKESTGEEINIDEIPLDDDRTYEMLCRGEGVGVFQLESSGMRTLLRDLKPETFEDIIALVALYRPGPLGSGMVDDFVKSKHGQKKVTYLHPKLEPILKDTYGVILYQEQVMRIASDLAGFTLGEADLLRRAMGKKKPEIIAGLREQFIQGAEKNNVEGSIAGKIFDLMEYFAGYGFNKSHSAAYAMVAYQTAYMKANYPHQYMAALLTSVQDNTDKVVVYVAECKRMGIEVLPPDVNESVQNFVVVGDKIRFGLAAVKNVGLGAVEAIIKARKQDGPFKSYDDFCSRLDTRVVNRRVMEGLIRGGAFDTLGYKRAQLMAALEEGLEVAHQAQKERESGQLSLLDLCADSLREVFKINIPEVEEYPKEKLLAMEKETLGLYISGHPLDKYRNILEDFVSCYAMDISGVAEQTEVTLGGIISAVKKISTRKGDPMAFVTLEDPTGSVETVVFPDTYAKSGYILEIDTPVLLRGRVSGSGDEAKVIAQELCTLEDAGRELFLRFTRITPDIVSYVRQVLRRYRGFSPVYLYFPRENRLAKAGDEFRVNLDSAAVNELQRILGIDNVKITRMFAKNKRL